MPGESLNLIPAAVQRQHRTRELCKPWGFAGLLGLFGLLSVAVVLGIELQSLSDALVEQKQQNRPTRVVLDHVAHFHQELTGIRERASHYEQLDPVHSPLTDLRVIARIMRECRGRVVLRSFRFHSNDQPPAAGTQSASATQMSLSTVSLTGQCPSDTTIAEFVAGLENAGVFSRVKLLSTSSNGDPQQPLKDFAIEIQTQIEAQP